MHADDPNHNSLTNYFEIILLARTSIDKSHLPISDQEIFFSNLDDDDTLNIPVLDDIDETYSLPDFLHVDQNIMSKFEYAFNNYTYKEIKNH